MLAKLRLALAATTNNFLDNDTYHHTSASALRTKQRHLEVCLYISSNPIARLLLRCRATALANTAVISFVT